MGLQVRVRHALGERVVDLPVRPAKNALAIGRAREAVLQIPSAGVAPLHCALFVHKGQWMVMDVSGTGSTFLNGSPATKKRPLSIGDVITLGAEADPPTIEIEPAAAAEGKRGIVTEGPGAEVDTPAPPQREIEAAPAAPHWTAPGGAVEPFYARPPAAPRALPPQPVRKAEAQFLDPASQAVPFGNLEPDEREPAAFEAEAPPDESVEGNAFEWNAEPSASGGAVAYGRRKRTSSTAAVLATVAVAILIVGGTVLFAVRQRNRQAAINSALLAASQIPAGAAPRVIKIPASQPATQTSPAAVAPAPPGPQTQPVEVTVVPPGPPANDAGPAAPDADNPQPSPQNPPDADLSWAEMERAHNLPDQALALVKFDDYRRLHPGQFADQLDAFSRDAFDQLWLQRLDQLRRKRERIMNELAAKEGAIAAETEAAFKEKLLKEQKDLQSQRESVDAAFASDMGVAPDAPVTPDDETLKARDAAKFAAWKSRTFRYIRSHNGRPEWLGDD